MQGPERKLEATSSSPLRTHVLLLSPPHYASQVPSPSNPISLSSPPFRLVQGHLPDAVLDFTSSSSLYHLSFNPIIPTHHTTHRRAPRAHSAFPPMRRLNGAAAADDEDDGDIDNNDGPPVLCVQCDRPITRHTTSSTSARRSPPPPRSPSAGPPSAACRAMQPARR